MLLQIILWISGTALQHSQTYLVQTITSWKPMQTTAKKSSKFTKKITHLDDMMVHNLVKYLVQTRLRFRLLDIKRTNFKSGSCPNDLLEICYFYISQTKSSLDKIFFKLCIIISSICVIFLVNLDDYFVMVCTGFYEVVLYTRYVP